MAKNRVKTHMHLFFSLIDRFYGYRSAYTFDAHKVDIRTETDFLKSLLTNILGISASAGVNACYSFPFIYRFH